LRGEGGGEGGREGGKGRKKGDGGALCHRFQPLIEGRDSRDARLIAGSCLLGRCDSNKNDSLIADETDGK